MSLRPSLAGPQTRQEQNIHLSFEVLSPITACSAQCLVEEVDAGQDVCDKCLRALVQNDLVL